MKTNIIICRAENGLLSQWDWKYNKYPAYPIGNIDQILSTHE